MNNQTSNSSDIVVIASCNVDLISYVERFPNKSETLMGIKFQTGFGGKGANKAIAASRLGSNVSVIAKLGDDVFGKNYLQNFKDNNINASHIFITDKAATGVAPICVDKNGDNSIIVILGANLLLSTQDVESCEILIKSSKILVTNLEIPLETAFFSVKLARTHNVITVLNFAPATIDYNKELWNYVDYLILNEVEIEQLSKVQVKNVDDAKKACLSLSDELPEIRNGIICTLGENGVIYINCQNKSIYHKQLKEKVKVVDSAGAGDAFVGAFAHYLNKYGCESIVKVIDLASDYASLTVQSNGTQSSYPKITELEDKFKI